jgi:hypothetical protein
MRTVLTVIVLVLAILASHLILDAVSKAHAQTKPPHHCVWTYINDSGEPNIGEDGAIDFSKGPNWKKLSDEGWELKAVKENNYIFERCEP